VDGAQRVAGAAEGDELGVMRPAAAVDGVEGDGDGQLELALIDVPDLDLAEAAGVAAGGGEPFAVWGEGERLDAFGDADEPGDQARAVGLVQENLVIAGDGEQVAVAAERQAIDDWRLRVDRRMDGQRLRQP